MASSGSKNERNVAESPSSSGIFLNSSPGILLRARFQFIFVGPLGFQNPIQLSQLGQSHRRVQLADAEVCPHDGMPFGSAVVSNVVMAVIRIGVGRFI
jgi:hypothetical protein